MQWYEAVAASEAAGRPHVLATVLATTGSTPRDAGDKMVVTQDALHGSVGGGQLEFMVVERARKLLKAGAATLEIDHYPLAAAAQQCCGGSVTVLFECRCRHALEAFVFGAGHVGAQVARLLSELPATVHWVDERQDAFDPAVDVFRRHTTPLDAVDAIGAASHVLILTHDHDLDYRILARLLGRGVFRSVGLIGSTTKWQRFRERLLRDGVAADALRQVRCPVGRDDVPGKQPMAVAISIVAELLELHGERPAPAADALTWRRVKSALVRSDAAE